MNLDKVIADIQKLHGETIIRKASELPKWEVFPTGLPELDYDLGGGLLVGQTTEIAGVENSGKTALASKIAGRFQKFDIPVFYFDIDKKFDVERAKLFGFDPEKAIVIRGELTAENVFEIVRDTVRAVKSQKDSRGLFVVDSLAAMVSEALFEKSASAQFGGSARMINQSTRVWQLVLGENQTLIEIQEFRENLGMGEDNMMPGGQGQKFVSSNIIWLRTGATIKDADGVIGQEMKWTIKKTKTSSPKETGMINFHYKTGFDVETSLINTAIEMKLLEQKGAGYYILPNGEQIRGKDKFISMLREDKKLLTDLEKLIYDKMPNPIWNGGIDNETNN